MENTNEHVEFDTYVVLDFFVLIYLDSIAHSALQAYTDLHCTQSSDCCESDSAESNLLAAYLEQLGSVALLPVEHDPHASCDCPDSPGSENHLNRNS